MDRRITRTKKLIFDAFYKLIQEKDYSKISIQDIIDEANIGRSTFYDHFETKDDLLSVMCKNLFEHIFNPSLNDTCPLDSESFKDKILHIFSHLLEKSNIIKGILSSESHDIFIRHFKEYLDKISDSITKKIDSIPKDFLKNYITGSLINLVTYWVESNYKYSPKDLCDYYLSILPKEIRNL